MLERIDVETLFIHEEQKTHDQNRKECCGITAKRLKVENKVKKIHLKMEFTKFDRYKQKSSSIGMRL